MRFRNDQTLKMETRISTLKDAIGEVRKIKLTAARIKLARQTREALFNTVYPLSHNWKICAWIFLVMWTIFVIMMTWNYGIKFHLQYEAEKRKNDPNADKYDEGSGLLGKY